MNVQDAREWLKERIEALDTDGKWTTTLKVTEEYSATRTVEIGHAAPTPDSFKRRRIALPVRWVVKESNEEGAVRDMYAAISFAPDSIVFRLLDLDQVRSVEVTEVGKDLFGPSGFIVAESEITVVVDDTTVPTDEESS